MYRRNTLEVLRNLNVPCEALDRRGCLKVEPPLAEAPAEFVGGLRLPDDETGDCRLFTERLAAMAEVLGVTFSYSTELLSLVTDGRAVTSAATSRGLRIADGYVVALGTRSPVALKELGIRLPVHPVKGYSLSIPIVEETMAPVSTLMDQTYKTAITRLGVRIRAGGTAELAGFDTTLRTLRRAALEHSVGQLFPFSGNMQKATFWNGLHPMTPDGPPILGNTPLDRLFLNTGHGTLGWTMACGCGRVLSDIIYGETPEVETAGLNLSRYSR